MSEFKKAQADFNSALNRLAYQKGINETFTDLLDTIICGMVLHDEKGLKRNPIKDYIPADQETMKVLLTTLGIIADNAGEGLHDALGDIFMEHLSFGRNGQYFTPQPICDMMTQMTFHQQEIKPNQTVNDCACGSGRMLLAAAKLSREFRFYGSDIDLTCVKMATVNLALNNLRGEISWANPLTMEHYASFRVEREIFSGFPVIYIVGEQNSVQFGPKVLRSDDEKDQEKSPESVTELYPQKERIEYQQLSLFV